MGIKFCFIHQDSRVDFLEAGADYNPTRLTNSTRQRIFVFDLPVCFSILQLREGFPCLFYTELWVNFENHSVPVKNADSGSGDNNYNNNLKTE